MLGCMPLPTSANPCTNPTLGLGEKMTCVTSLISCSRLTGASHGIVAVADFIPVCKAAWHGGEGNPRDPPRFGCDVGPISKDRGRGVANPDRFCFRRSFGRLYFGGFFFTAGIRNRDGIRPPAFVVGGFHPVVGGHAWDGRRRDGPAMDRRYRPLAWGYGEEPVGVVPSGRGPLGGFSGDVQARRQAGQARSRGKQTHCQRHHQKTQEPPQTPSSTSSGAHSRHMRVPRSARIKRQSFC